MTDKLDPPHDQRPARGGWAPGNYFNRCLRCSAGFFGDKRAYWCADCAYAPEPDERAIPLAESDGLSREKILLMWSEIESGRALPLAEDLRTVFSLALRALPDGEPDPLSDLVGLRERVQAAIAGAVPGCFNCTIDVALLHDVLALADRLQEAPTDAEIAYVALEMFPMRFKPEESQDPKRLDEYMKEKARLALNASRTWHASRTRDQREG